MSHIFNQDPHFKMKIKYPHHTNVQVKIARQYSHFSIKLHTLYIYSLFPELIFFVIFNLFLRKLGVFIFSTKLKTFYENLFRVHLLR
jgi:hypothetical protein